MSASSPGTAFRIGSFPPNRFQFLAPDLAIEVLSASNTEGEMQRKLHDYFTAGVRLVWYIDPHNASAKSYTAEDQFVEVDRIAMLSPAATCCRVSSCR